ncbi:ice-binding family protein, partial [Nocardioides sp.]|uniref:ice-binding family protein n=1 Tax=Nocardioides sp. TaxID=35761 RepID=UPI00273365A6
MALGASALLVATQLATVLPAAGEPSALAASATFVDLGTAASYSVLAGTGVANTGAGSVLDGDLGLSPAGLIAGFPPGTVNGTINDKNASAGTAQNHRQAAYTAAAAQTSTASFAGDQAGATFTPGVHTAAAAISNSGTVTLDAEGDDSAVFVFQVGAALSSAAATKVVLTDGALANNVYWQVGGALSLGAGAAFVGTVLATGAITFGEGASLKGRALTPDTVTLANSPVIEPIDDLVAPVVTIDGGPTRSTSDTTPSISGTADEPPGRPVTVTVGGQTLVTSIGGAAGGWSVSAAALTEGAHTVVASVTDASQNTGTATQVLTVDVTPPDVSIDGGARRATNDTTPTISGATDEPEDSTVSVNVDGQTLASSVAANGTWSVQAAQLEEAAHLVSASVTDAANNTGTTTQVLVVDVTVPVVTIDGGAARTTSDTSPWTYGTTAEKAGTTVHVTVGGQHLTATVLSGGTWGVSAATLPTGTHTVVASITDAAQNTGTATQALTISAGAPSVPGDPDPVPTPRYQPDAAIRLAPHAFVGVGVYGPGQKVKKRLTKQKRRATFTVRVTNAGNATDRMTVRGTPRNRAFKVVYRSGGENVTRAIKAGTVRTGALQPGQSARLAIKVTRTKKARSGDRRKLTVRATSTRAPTRSDRVIAVV